MTFIVAAGLMVVCAGGIGRLLEGHGRMSAIAGRALLDAGYTDVALLQGGTDAWERAGLSRRDR
ncbi:MAG: rhodanese-like domain-containing protein [Acidimicrobiia bacterium]